MVPPGRREAGEHAMSNQTAERVAEVIEKHVGDLVNDVHFGAIVDDVLAAVGE